jgi:hypothetical protein
MVEIVSLVIGVSGVLFGVNCYWHLRKWARDCQQATVAIAYKRKVVMSPTLVELVLWSRKVPDKQNGQVFYKAPNVTVAIIKRDRRSWRTRRQLRKNQTKTGSRFGTWKLRQDETP